MNSTILYIIMLVFIIVIASVIFTTIFMAVYTEVPKRRVCNSLYKFRDKPLVFDYKGKTFSILYRITCNKFLLYEIGDIIINDKVAATVVIVDHLFFKSRQIKYDFPEEEVYELFKVASKIYNKRLIESFSENKKTLF